MTRDHFTRAAAARAGTDAAILHGLFAGAALLALAFPTDLSSGRFDVAAKPATLVEAGRPAAAVRLADFGTQLPSPDARQIADWVAESRDNAGSDFVIVDKKFATVHVFDSQARLRASSPVLLGAARGDDSVAGIGTRPIAAVRPEERTTPAGRFVARLGRNAQGEDVVWVDYDTAVSMHRVRTANPAEHRLQRLATQAIEDKRISYGCINVPVAFYEGVIRPVFAARAAVVYVLPEVKSVRQVFGPAAAECQPCVRRTVALQG
jgi:hypothetical protein